MKKIFALMLALALCLSMGAMAEGKLQGKGGPSAAEQTANVTGEQPADGPTEGAATLLYTTQGELIRGTELMYVEGDSGYALATLDGTLLTDDVYSDDFSADSGVLITAQYGGDEYNAWGVMAYDGSTVMPFRYGDVEVLNAHWAIGYVLKESTADHYDYSSWFDGDLYLLIETVDVYDLDTGACVVSLPRENFADAYAEGEYINIENRADGSVTTYDGDFNVYATDASSVYDTYDLPVELESYYESGLYGLRDGEGNVVLAPAYEMIGSFRRGYAYAELNDKTGLIDEQGTLIVPAEYEDILYGYYLPEDEDGSTSGFVANGYVAVVSGGKVGYVDLNGVMTCQQKYSEDALDINGASATYTDPEGLVHIIAADGVETVVDYASVYPLDYASGMFYRVNDEEYNYGVIDWHGNVVLDTVYGSMHGVSGDGRYIMMSVDYETNEIYELTVPVATGVVEAVVDPEAARTAINDAIALLNQDAAANCDAVIGLLNDAKAALGDANAAVTGLLDSAVTMLSQSSSNGAAVVAMLSTAATMF